MAKDPPARSTTHSQARHRPSPTKRRQAPPLDTNKINNGANNRNEQFIGTNNSPALCHAPTTNQLHNRQHPRHQQHRPDLIIRAHDCHGRDVRPSLRKRGSSLRPTPPSSSSRHYHENNNTNNNNYSMDVASTEDEQEGYATTMLSKHHPSSSLSTATTTTNNNNNNTSAATYAIKNRHSTQRLSRMTAILFICILTYWASSWWMETTIDIARFTIHLMFGNGMTRKQFYSSIAATNHKSQQYYYKHDDIYEDAHPSSVSNKAVVAGGLRGSSMIDERVSTIHDLNAKSHLLKAKGRQILPDYEQALLLSSVENNIIIDEGNGQRDTSNMLDQDETNDFFFAGKVMETKRIVNNLGRIDTISYLTHSYATLPVSLDANLSFAMSIWVNLSSLSSLLEYNDSNGGVEFDNTSKRRPRVILSTHSTARSEGCYSDHFGNIPTAGFVLYAEPSIGDESDDWTSYRIILEYARAGAQSCRMIGFGPQSHVLVEVGSWHHIALFFTRISKEEQEFDRISVYVNGFLSGRTEDVSSPSMESQTEATTIIGRYTTQADESDLGSNNDFFLGGRVGMLSLWQTESNASLSEPNRMNIQSPSDEDHVVRAIFRAAFDIRSIQELALLGLTVKEPSLLYTFDGQNSRDATIDLYSEPDRSIYERMSGKRIGTIVCEVIDDNPAHHRQNFVPLGGNRYARYKDGSFVSPQMTASERQEFNEIARARSALIKKAMQHLWSGYETYAYGKDELLPISKSGQDNWGGMGTTLVDSLSTLWIMGLKDEFWKARDWVRDVLDFNQVKVGASVFETTIRTLAGLLSAYDLSGDNAFLDRSDDLGMRLMRAFDSETGIPYGEIELFDGGRSYNTGWHSDVAVLSEIGTLQVEFRYLAKVTGKSEYATRAMRALDELLKLDSSESGLFPTFIYNTNQVPSFGNDEISLGAMGDSFYEYLLKVWLQGGKRETKYRQMYDKSVHGIIDRLLHTSQPNHLTYVAELKGDLVIHKMDHLACFLGGTLALGAYSHPDGLESTAAQRQLKIGKQLAYTCYQMYARSKSGLSPEFVRFDNRNDDFATGSAPYYILRPETVETLFVLYHLTKDPVYREWGWEIFQAIEEHCKTEAGYAAIQNVDTMEKNNRMESFFPAETLKYLYLLQDDDHDIDLLNKHVFNTEAHPLRLLSLAPEN